MATPAVEGLAFAPGVIPIQDGEPHPLACWPGDVHVYEVGHSLLPKPAEVIDEDRVVGVGVWVIELQRPLFDLNRKQSNSIWVLTVVAVLVVLADHNLAAMGHGAATLTHGVNPPPLRGMALLKCWTKGTHGGSCSMSKRGCHPTADRPDARVPAWRR